MHVAIGLGSNLGDRIANLRMAVTELEERFGALVAVSSLYRSDPVGGPDQPDYLNAVAVIDTDRSLGEVFTVDSLARYGLHEAKHHQLDIGRGLRAARGR